MAPLQALKLIRGRVVRPLVESHRLQILQRLLPGTGSPRKTAALERWRQHEITAYQRTISADGSRLKATARLVASFLMKPTVSLAQKPCLSKDKAQKSKACIRLCVRGSKIG